jgi:AbrB family looped-hinge helix DNA binding protein
MKEFNVIGMVRTMDDLGRVVIPKEIRKTLDIKEGDTIDILPSVEGVIILRKSTDGKPTCPCPCVNAEEEKKIYTFTAEYDNDVKVIKITKEQEKLLLYLEREGMLSGDWTFNNGYPDTEDLT